MDYSGEFPLTIDNQSDQSLYNELKKHYYGVIGKDPNHKLFKDSKEIPDYSKFNPSPDDNNMTSIMIHGNGDFEQLPKMHQTHLNDIFDLYNKEHFPKIHNIRKTYTQAATAFNSFSPSSPWYENAKLLRDKALEQYKNQYYPHMKKIYDSLGTSEEYEILHHLTGGGLRVYIVNEQSPLNKGKAILVIDAFQIPSDKQIQTLDDFFSKQTSVDEIEFNLVHMNNGRQEIFLKDTWPNVRNAIIKIKNSKFDLERENKLRLLRHFRGSKKMGIFKKSQQEESDITNEQISPDLSKYKFEDLKPQSNFIDKASVDLENHVVAITPKNGKFTSYYTLSDEQLEEVIDILTSSDSFGSYYNQKLRGKSFHREPIAESFKKKLAEAIRRIKSA